MTETHVAAVLPRSIEYLDLTQKEMHDNYQHAGL